MIKRKLKQPIVKLRVLCERCGGQALVAVPKRAGRLPAFACGYCGDREPLVEHIKR